MTLTTADTTRANADRSGQGIYPFEDFEQRFRLVEDNTKPAESDSFFAGFGVGRSPGRTSYVDPYAQRRRTVVYWTAHTSSPLATITSQVRWGGSYDLALGQSGSIYETDSAIEIPEEWFMRLHFALTTHYGMSEDPLGIRARLQGFKDLKDGWADGMQPASDWGQEFGKAPPSAGLNWLMSAFGSRYSINSPKPYLYPTPEGGVQAEWSLGSHEISLTIDLQSHMAEWHWLDIDTDEDVAQHLNLDDRQSWIWLQEQLSRMEASQD